MSFCSGANRPIHHLLHATWNFQRGADGGRENTPHQLRHRSIPRRIESASDQELRLWPEDDSHCRAGRWRRGWWRGKDGRWWKWRRRAWAFVWRGPDRDLGWKLGSAL